jgi:hypothetical protein
MVFMGPESAKLPTGHCGRYACLSVRAGLFRLAKLYICGAKQQILCRLQEWVTVCAEALCVGSECCVGISNGSPLYDKIERTKNGPTKGLSTDREET